MQTKIFYVFEPTPTLRDLAMSAGEEYIAKRSVWIVQEHDRVGAEYSERELAHAHWVQFLANLFGEPPESATLADFRAKCLALGFEGCWTVSDAKLGGDAKDLIDEVKSAQTFLAERGVTLS